MRNSAVTIGILGLQGCVEPHLRHLKAAGAEVRELRRAEDFESVDGLILPGGESTTMLKLLDVFGLRETLARELQTKPAWGICAGAILLARTVDRGRQVSFSALDIEIARNAYGRQLSSFNAEIDNFPVAFIRAPRIENTGPGVEVVARYEGTPVWVMQKNTMATTFHPELSEECPSPMHRQFVHIVGRNRTSRTAPNHPKK